MSAEYPDAKHRDEKERGAQFQDRVMLALAQKGIALQLFTSRKYQYEVGESIQGIEIKYDWWCTRSGRLSIEIAEKSKAANALWVPSGIYRPDNSWLYLQGNEERIWIFLKKILVGMHGIGKYEEHEEGGTVRGFYLPLEIADKYGHIIPL